MAIVRISKQLMDDVNDLIVKMRHNALASAEQLYNPTRNAEHIEEMFKLGFDAAWGVNKHLYDVVPQKWLLEIKSMSITVGNRESTFTVERRAFVPPDHPHGYGAYIEVRIPKDKCSAALYTAVETYENKKKELETKYNSVGRQIEGFLRNSKSLNAACSTYPNLRLYIPKPYLDRMDEVVVRKPKGVYDEEVAEAVEQLDDSLLASVGVIHAITGSKGD